AALRAISQRVNGMTSQLADFLRPAGVDSAHDNFFDTLRLDLNDPDAVVARAAEAGMNLRRLGTNAVGISLDETSTEKDIGDLCQLFGAELKVSYNRQSAIGNRQ